MNILMTSAGSGRRMRLVKAFVSRMGRSDPPGRVVVVDADPFTPGLYESEASYVVPNVSSNGFDERIIDICRREKVGWIIPTTDADIEHFSKKASIYAGSGVKPLVSDAAAVSTCNDKRLFYRYFADKGYRVPKCFDGPDEAASSGCPMFVVKPAKGAGSRDLFLVEDKAGLDFHFDRLSGKEPLIQEHIVGREYTIDVLLDLEGRPVSVVPRERRSTRAGVSDIGITTDDERLVELGLNVACELNFRGPINIQCIEDSTGGISLLEINPRFSGGISLTLASGADFVDWAATMMEGGDPGRHIGEFTPSLVMMVYEEALYRSLENITGEAS